MAKRKMLFHPDYVREKIRASQLINRLQKCAFGEISLTMTQLRAIEILLRKCIPDLAAAEIMSEQRRRCLSAREAQAIFRRRRHQPRRPPLVNTNNHAPEPTAGMGTAAGVVT